MYIAIVMHLVEIIFRNNRDPADVDEQRNVK